MRLRALVSLKSANNFFLLRPQSSKVSQHLLISAFSEYRTMAVVPASSGSNVYLGDNGQELVNFTDYGHTAVAMEVEQQRCEVTAAIATSNLDDGHTAVAMEVEQRRELTASIPTSSGEVRSIKYAEVNRLMIVAFFERIHENINNMEGIGYENGGDTDDLGPDSCCEQTTDLLYRSCTCDSSNLTSGKFTDVLGFKPLLSNSLGKARYLGMKFLFGDGIIFPLLNHILRDIVVTAQLLYTFAGLILSVVSYIHADCHQAFNIVNFVLGSLAAVLSIASSFEALYRRNVFRTHCCKNDQKKDNSHLTQVVDLSRTVVAEILIYPILICSIFGLVTSQQVTQDQLKTL